MNIIEKIAYKIKLHGGEAYFVGGCVRDKVMRNACTDFDIEVHRITDDVLRSILDDTAAYSSVGKNYGVYSLCDYPVDFALARKDIARGKGHKDFDVELSPFMGKTDAAKRRDFTINSIMENVLTGEIFDPFDGLSDIKNKIIRHTNSETYSEDPLRILRAAEFSSRLGFEIADETVALSKKADLTHLSKERVFEYVCKALLNSEKPSVFFNALRKMNQLNALFKESDALSQSNWDRLMDSIDWAAFYKESASSPVGFMLCALSSQFSCSSAFVSGLTENSELKGYVLNMLNQLPHICDAIKEKSSIYETNKLFDNTVDDEGLVMLLKSVYSLTAEEESFIGERLAFYKLLAQNPDVTGKDLINAGFCAGKDFSRLLSIAHDMKLRGYKKEETIKILKVM